MLHRPAALSLALTVITACASPESKAVDSYVDASDAAADEICACEYDKPLALLAFGKIAYGSSAECSMDLGIDSAERGCVEGLFEDQSTDYTNVFDCRAAAARAGGACLNPKTCTDTARADCYTQYFDDLEDCPELPNDIEAKLDDCLQN